MESLRGYRGIRTQASNSNLLTPLSYSHKKREEENSSATSGDSSDELSWNFDQIDMPNSISKLVKGNTCVARTSRARSSNSLGNHIRSVTSHVRFFDAHNARDSSDNQAYEEPQEAIPRSAMRC